MKKLLFIFAAATLMLAGCAKQSDFEDLEQRVSHMEGHRIVSVEGQILNILNSVGDLQRIQTEMESKFAALDKDRKAASDSLPDLVKEAARLSRCIDDLEDYADGLATGAKSWAEATFATIGQMDGALQRLASLEKLMPELQTTIAGTASGIKQWVGVELEAYATTAAMEAAIEAVESRLAGKTDTAKDSLAREVTQFKEDLKTMKNTVTAAYQEAIRVAVDDFHGKVSNIIDGKIKDATDHLNESVQTLSGKVSAMEIGLSSAEKRLDDVISRIQSVAVVPMYSDGSVRLNGGDFNKLCFEVSPVTAARALVSAADACEFFSVIAVDARTKASSFTEFPVESVSMDASDELVEVTVSLPLEYTATSTMMARLKIETNDDNDNYVCRTSGFFCIFRKFDRNLAFYSETITKNGDDVPFVNALSGLAEGVTFISSRPEVAAVDEEGKVTIMSPGQTIITASAPETDDCMGGSASYKLLVAPKDAVHGFFSISTTKKVFFSKGNLQATYDAAASDYSWNFASNQYEIAGSGTGEGKMTIINQDDGAKVDLFSWSAALSNYGIMPAMDDSKFVGDFIDWGLVFGASSPWRTLAKGEYDYLLTTRSTSAVGGVENARFAKVKINGVNGLLIFPDIFVWTESMGAAPSNCNVKGTAWSSVPSYNTVEFSGMESSGCVFLPVAGVRFLEDVFNDGGDNPCGNYWTSSSSGTETSADYMFFGKNDVGVAESLERYAGCSVRLVSDL